MKIQTYDNWETEGRSADGIDLGILTPLPRFSMFWMPERQAPSAWIEHVPFAFWLADVLRPRRIVELGTHNGVSYSAMCQAVKILGSATSCFAVDTWKGDEHAGFYGEARLVSVIRQIFKTLGHSVRVLKTRPGMQQ